MKSQVEVVVMEDTVDLIGVVVVEQVAGDEDVEFAAINAIDMMPGLYDVSMDPGYLFILKFYIYA